MVRACKDARRKAEAHLQFHLAEEVKDNKKGFVGALVTGNSEKAEILNVFFASVFTTKTAPQEYQALEVRERV